MALVSPTLVVEVNTTNTASFAAQTAGGYLVVAVTRNNGTDDSTIPTPAGWTQISQQGAGVPATSAERVAWFGKDCDGTETSITFSSNMSAGTRGITVFYVAVPAGGGGAWKVQTTKVTEGMTVAGLTVGDGADLTVLSDDSCVFALYQQSSSYASTGNMPAYAALTARGTAAVGRGRPGTKHDGARNAVIDVKATAVTDTRRLAFSAFVLSYLKKPTATITVPSDEASSVSTAAIPVTITVSGGNTDTVQVDLESSPEGAGTWTNRGTDTSSPYTGISIAGGTFSAGRYDLRPIWVGSGEFGFLQAINVGATIQVVITAAVTSNIQAVKYHNGTSWVDVVAVKYHNGTTWTTIWP